MDIVLGVSLTPTAVRMALVEGERADGVIVDRDSFDIAAGVSPATSDAPEQVVAAILGTRESAVESGHRLVATGVAWTDHAAAARLRQALRAQRIDDVILVSELHAASALAQAVGRAIDCDRTALLFLEADNVTLSVVRTFDGAVLRVSSRALLGDQDDDLTDMVANLRTGDDQPEALFVVGSGLRSGIDLAALRPRLAARSGLPVHAPDDGDLALARGAALAAANTPRYEASTVSLLSTEETAAGPTQMAAAGYLAPLGYSAVADDDADERPLTGAESYDEPADPGRAPFALVSGAVSGIFVVGVVALVISLAVAIRPTADQRPVPDGSAVVSNSSVPAPPQAREPAQPAAPETIQAPIPVVQEAPRTVVVTPPRPAALPAPVAPPPPPPAEPAPAPAPAPLPQPAPAPVSAAPVPAPAPAPAPVPVPIVVPIPVPPLLPPIFQVPARTPAPRYPSTTPTYPTETTASPSTSQAPQPTSTAPVTTTYPTYTAPVTTVAPRRGSDSDSGESGSEGSGGSSGDSSGSTSPTIWPPLWPFGG